MSDDQGVDCPNCALLNPESAARCDCGYDFVERAMRTSYLTGTQRTAGSREAWSTADRSAWLAQALGALVLGSVCTLVALFSVIAESGPRSHHSGLGDLFLIIFVAAAEIVAALVGLALMAKPASRKLGSLLCASGVGGLLLIVAVFWVRWSF